MGCIAPVYRPRDAEHTVLHQVVALHLEAFLGAACPRCGGRLRLIATLHDPAVIRKILAHLEISHSAQSPGPAPPEPSAVAP